VHIVKWFVGLCCFLGGCSYGMLGLGICACGMVERE